MAPRIGDEYQALLPDLVTCNSTNKPARMASDIPVIRWVPLSRKVECQPPATWTESDKETFIAGMFIFGKRLNLVRRFVEGKTMGNVLSYYYGEFYKSDGHRKSKAKGRVAGMDIFSGWRRPEILARLLEHVPNESHEQLEEIFKTYDQPESSFEDFIFKLKNTAGSHLLAKVIGIGKGLHDLTRIWSKPTHTGKSRSNNSAIKDSRSQRKRKDCSTSAPFPKRRRLTACQQPESIISCPIKISEDLESNSPRSHVHDTNQKMCPNKVVKEESELVSDGSAENEGLYGIVRRHGTRNRRPTAKVLESQALGLLGTERMTNKMNYFQ